MAALCHKMAPHSHVLDVVNVALDLCNDAVHLLLWDNRDRQVSGDVVIKDWLKVRGDGVVTWRRLYKSGREKTAITPGGEKHMLNVIYDMALESVNEVEVEVRSASYR